MTSSGSCPECGGAVRDSVLGGLCPRCVGRRSLGFARRVAIADSPIADRLHPVVLTGSGPMRVGDYEVESEIARGGMGVVYRARQAGLNRPVALKLLLAGQFADPGQVKRFRAEAAALARLDHPAIVPIHEVGEFEGRHFFSMRLIEGPSLAKAMPRFHLAASVGGQEISGAARRAALRTRQRELAGFIAVIARAVHYAHLRGVLHRDLKPGNVLLDAQGAPHVTDFGLARCMDTDAGVTASGMVFGTPAYMPPEQTVDPHNVSVAADVYSLGAIAYEVLTGRPPFEAGSPVETVIQVREREPIRPGDLEPGIDRDLETVVLKCLEKDPSARYGTALELAEDLDRFVKDVPVLARPVSSSVRAWRWTRRHPLVSALGSLAALLLVTLIVGGSAMVLRIWDESRQKDEASLRARRELRSALLAQAQAQRLRGGAIQREANLDSVAAAAGIQVIPEVVHEAVAQLARLDVSRAGSRRPLPGPGLSLTCRPDFSEYYQILPSGAVAAYSTTNHEQRWIQERLPMDASPGVLWASPDLQHLALERGGVLTLMRTSDGSVAWQQPVGNILRFSPRGDWLLAQDQGREVRRLSMATGELLPFPSGVLGLSHEFALMPDPGRSVLVRLRSNRLEFVDWDRDLVVASIEHVSSLHIVDWHGHRLAACDAQGAVLVWHLPSRQPVVLRARFRRVESIQFVPGTSLLLVREAGGVVSCWDSDDGEAVLSVRGFVPEQFSFDGSQVRFTVGDQWGMASLLPPTGRVRYRLGAEETSWARQISFSSDSRLLSVVTVGGVHVFNLVSDRTPAFFPLFGALRAWFVPGRRELLVQGRDAVFQIAVGDGPGTPILTVQNQKRWPMGAWLEAGVFDARSQTVWVPRVGLGLEPVSFAGGPPRLPVALPEAGRALALELCPDRMVFGRSSGLPPATVDFEGRMEEVPQFGRDFVPVVSPDGQWLLAASRQDYRVLSVTNWATWHSHPLSGAVPEHHPPGAWSSDSRWAATYHDFDTIAVRDVRSRNELLRLTTPQPAALTCLAFSPGGRWLAAGTDRGLVEVWDFQELAQGLEPLHLTMPIAIHPSEQQAPALARTLWVERIELPAAPPHGFAPRDPSARPQQLDLTSHYNARLDKSWTLVNPETLQDSLFQLPTGLQTLDGVLFDIRGVVQLDGERFRAQEMDFPQIVPGITVGLPLRRLHLLGAANDAYDKLQRGMELVRVRLHYAGGGSAELPLRLGFELGDRWTRAHRPRGLQNATVGWYGINGATESYSPSLRETLYHVALPNPSPDRVVDRIDLIAPGASPAPFFVAISVE